MNLLKVTEDITKQELHDNIGQIVILNYLIDTFNDKEIRKDVSGPLTFNAHTDKYMVYNVDDDLTFTIDNVMEVEYTHGVLKISLC